eukprot:3496158-Pyramimonas_sp.AAC.1
MSAIGQLPCLLGGESGPLTSADRLDLQLNVRVLNKQKIVPSTDAAYNARTRASGGYCIASNRTPPCPPGN